MNGKNKIKYPKELQNIMSLFENSIDCSIILDLNGRIVYVNKAALEIGNFNLEEVTGKYLEEINLFKISDLLLINKKFGNVIAGNTGKIEFCITNNKGTEYNLDLSGTPVKINGKVEYILIIGKDISSIRKADKEKDKIIEETKKELKNYENKTKTKKRRDLTVNEKIVLYYLVRFPDKTDQEISNISGIVRTTITTIRNRLKKRKLFSTQIIPNFRLLGYKIISVFTFTTPVESEMKKALEFESEDSAIVYYKATGREFFAICASKDITQAHKTLNKFTKFYQDNHIKLDEVKTFHFPSEICIFKKFFDYENILKKEFSLMPEQISRSDSTMRDERNKDIFNSKISLNFSDNLQFNKNQMKIISFLSRNPESSIKDISKKVNLSKNTITKNIEFMISEGYMKKVIIPDLFSLNIKLELLTYNTSINKDYFTEYLDNPDNNEFFTILTEKDRLQIKIFKTHEDYVNNSKNKIKNTNDSDKESTFEILIKDKSSEKIKFYELFR